MTNFTPWSALAGGACIGLSASMLLLLNGRIAGISGIAAGLLPRQAQEDERERAWRAWFVAGLLAGGVVLTIAHPASIGSTPAPSMWAAVGGLLVGFGTRLGGGCTSGHGVCGLSRLSVRSLAATLTFMVTGGLATYAVWHLVLAHGSHP